MCGMTHVELVRHGDADFGPINDRGWPGLASELAPLTDAGIAQAFAAADALAGAGATYLVSAPATKALQTATLIGYRLALRVRVDFDLREWVPDRSGDWRGPADANAALREFEEADGEWPTGQTRPWETATDVRTRAEAALHRHAAQTDGVIIAVTHPVLISVLTGDRDIEPGGIHKHLLGALPTTDA